MNMSRHKSLVPQLVKRLPRQSSLRRIKVFTSVTIRVLQSSSIHLRATCHQIQRYQLRSQSTTTYVESLTMSSFQKLRVSLISTFLLASVLLDLLSEFLQTKSVLIIIQSHQLYQCLLLSLNPNLSAKLSRLKTLVSKESLLIGEFLIWCPRYRVQPLLLKARTTKKKKKMTTSILIS